MSKNDEIVLRANFDDWKNRADGIGNIDPWLYYCLEQFLKPYGLDDEETLAGITEGGNDGGADAIYFIVNHRILVEDDSDIDPKSVSNIRLIFFQVKTGGGMKPTEIDKWLPLTDDFFDLEKEPASFGKRYNDKVKLMMSVWREQYLRMIINFPEVAVDYYYITGEDAEPDEYANEACERIETKAKKLTKAACTVRCIGAQELWDQVQRRPPKTRILKWSEQPMSTAEGFVGLVKLTDYFAFLEDSPGEIAERIFESNVRGFQPASNVNDGIAKSLKGTGGPNFWLLNNGITVIATQAIPAGHRGLGIDDPQIVNGLQTSRVIFAHVKANPDSNDDRSVLVRVIPTVDQATQDSIIQATNSQNKMTAASLRMTDQIHRDIEEIFKKVDLYYDRRKGFWRDQGRPIRKIISVNAVTQAVVSILLQRPDDARGRPGDYLKEDAKYELAFDNPKIPVQAYLLCLQIMQRVEKFLAEKNVDKSDAKNLKFYVAALVAREAAGFTPPAFSKLPPIAKIDEKLIDDSYKRTLRIYMSLSKAADKDAVARGSLMLKKLNAQWKRRRAKAKGKTI